MKFTNKTEANDYINVLRYRIHQIGEEIDELESEQERLVQSYVEACRYQEFA
jgi:hypothetical protein